MRVLDGVLIAVTMVGCGRIGFAPQEATESANDGATDGMMQGTIVPDARVGTGDNGSCATAVDLPLGTSFANEMVDAADDVAPWGLCANGTDVVYRVTIAAMADVVVTARADFNGMVTTGELCPPALNGPSSCYTMAANQTFQRTYTFSAGTTYIIVDKLSGTGDRFEISVQ